MLIRYIGISFITGAISHGFFSGWRQIATAIAGIVLFIIGSLLEEWSEKIDSWKVVISGTILAIGIGAVTGWLQHFPDSPERSLWIIPVGYIISLVFYAHSHKYTWNKKSYIYWISTFIGVTLLSIALFLFIEKSGISWHSHDELPKTQNTIQQNTQINTNPVVPIVDSHDSNTDHPH
jgi:hypothetical protein